MYKVLLVDDDVEMLEGLVNFIPWEAYGFTVAATAKNGFEALNLITKYMPDLLITDITMPLMDGLNLIRETKKFIPHLKTMLISCHEEFDYAREAIYVQADEYLIKHTLTEDTLIRGIEKIHAMLEAESNPAAARFHRSNVPNRRQPEAVSKFFEGIAYGDFKDYPAIKRHADAIHLSISPNPYRAIAFFADDLSEPFIRNIARQFGTFRMGILNILDGCIDPPCAIPPFFVSEDTFVALLEETKTTHRSDCIALVEKCLNAVEKAIDFRLSACVGTTAFPLERFQSALEALACLRNAYFYEGSGKIIEHPVNFPIEDMGALYKKYAPALKSAIAMNDSDKLFEASNQLLSEDFRNFCPTALKSALSRILIETALTVDTYDLSTQSLQIKGNTFGAYKEAFINVIEHMADNMRTLPLRVKHPEIEKALNYIHENLSGNVSCEGTAAHVNMNPSYFSRLFKRETGDNFSDYLIKKRMQAATELLLHSNCTIEEIAHLTGIESISYFYRAYKKYTGKTPGDVRSCQVQ